MPPKKQAGSKGGASTAAIEEDLSDVALLPMLNEFIFTNFYAFKYRKNQDRVEQQMLKHFNVPAEGETAESAKRNKTVVLADLLTQAKAKHYFTEEEAADLQKVEQTKVRQVLARTTNEILASITMPLRRQKAEEADKFKESLEKIADAGERNKAKAEHEAKANDVELTVFLKDFPSNAEDFKELRRSGAQHQPEIEVAIQALFMVEELFQKDEDDDDDLGVPARESALDARSVDGDEPSKPVTLSKEARVKAFTDFSYINKFARNCNESSQMRLMTAQKFKFSGPDPPQEPVKQEIAEEEKEEVKAAPAAKGKKVEEVPVEVEMTEEEKAELQMFEIFIEEFVSGVTKAKEDISEYRALVCPKNGVEKVALWPKVFTLKEIEKLKKEEEERIKREEAADEEKRRLEEEKQVAAAPAKKGAPAKKAEQKPQSRAGVSSAQSGEQKQSTRPSVMEEILRKQKTMSMDDQDRNFDFSSYERAMSQLESASTSIGGVLAAMVYQIEQDNLEEQKAAASEAPQKIHHQGSQQLNQLSLDGQSVGALQPLSNFNSIGEQSDKLAGTEGGLLGGALDDIYNQLVIEHGVMHTDYSHQFDAQKVHEEMNGSPYQALFQEADGVGINDKKFTFMDGTTTANLETKTLNKMHLPGVNDRFKMPKKATRTQAERESDTQAILKLYPNVTNQGKRLIVLKAFEQLLKEENPEREYEFQRRNFTEEMDPNTFRQVLVEAIRLCTDVNTVYFDKEDALLLALNFKNPPGRLLRRQWTYPIKTLPDIATWKQFYKEEQCEIKTPFIDIPTYKAGLLRTNQKFCFPCDNSIIRVDKHYVGGRRFGASVIIKDNLVFGVREDETKVKEKVADEDELPNLETKKATKRDCDFWLEFQNKARLHISVVEPVEAYKELIPPQDPSEARSPVKKAEIGTVDEDEILSNNDEVMSPSGKSGATKTISGSQPEATEKQTIESKDKKVTDGKTVTIDASEPDEVKSKLEKQNSAAGMSKSALSFGPDYQPDQGSSMTFTYQEGLVVQILPNGNVQQTICKNQTIKKRTSVLQNETNDEKSEVQRIITRNAQVIIHLKDGNQIIYFPDGTITKTDHRKGIWTITNHLGVVRERNLRTGVVKDEMVRLSTQEKIDPETNALVNVREDGLLKIQYPDRRTLLVLPDHSEILITKTGPQEEGSAVTTTLFKKEGYAPVKITSDPVKARSGTIIGLGGTDALMGKDSIMERSYGGLISETYLPDKSIVQTYMEKQELPGYNKFSTSLIHLIKRDDFSMIKVRQDGEVVVITASERAYLNSIGKEMEFGVDDYDYFFELFGVPNERRSGVYTANLEQGRIWTADEEGNHFIIYANGDSTEKLSVSFNLDQMVEGIDNKEPKSPRVKDGEYIEDECKFLPPPKTVAHPRLFLVKDNCATEFMNEDQLEYLFMCNNKDKDIIASKKRIVVNNEKATSHNYMKPVMQFNPDQPAHLPADSIPRMPQALEMVNQTVSIATEPEVCTYLQRNILEFETPSSTDLEKFEAAIVAKDEMRQGQHEQRQKLKIEQPEVSKEQLTTQCRIMLRIARQKGIDVQTLIGDEYKQIKVNDRDERRQKILETLDDDFRPEGANGEAQSN